MSIRWRILLASILLGAAGLLVMAWLVVNDVRPHTFGTTEDSLAETAVVLASLLEAQPAEGELSLDALRATMDRALHRPLKARIYDIEKTAVELRVYVTDARGIVRYDSDGGKDEGQDYSTWRDVSRALRGEYGARASRRAPHDAFSSVFYVTVPLRRGEQVVGALSVGKQAKDVKGLVYSLNRKIAVAWLLGLGAATAISLALAAWITRPMERLGAYARDVGAGRRPPLPELGSKELRELGRTLEAMRGALDGRRDVAGYVRGLTHETKAPLSAIRAAAELLDEGLPPEDQRRFLTNIRTEAARLEQLVDRILELSALEARHSLKDVRPLDLAGIFHEVAESAQPIADQKGVALEVQVPAAAVSGATLPVPSGDPLLVRQALLNLVHNSLRWTPPEGRVVVAASATVGDVVLTVSDSGPGVPDYALPHVFEKFYSLAAPGEARGTGLGLPFVREVALLHGGDATLENSPGGGTRACLRFATTAPPRKL